MKTITLAMSALLTFTFATPAMAVNKAFNLDASQPAITCSTIPTQNEVNNGSWTYSDKIYSGREAVKAGIPLVNAKADGSFTIIVRDYRRSKPCIADDGKTTILYGQTIRTVIEMSDYNTEFGADLPAIAASGTLQRKKQSVYLYKDGFYNSKIDTIIASVSGKVFDVENYALYQSAMTQMIALLSSPDTTFSANPLLIIPPTDKKSLTEAPLIAYSLYNIQKKRSCHKAQGNLTAPGADHIIEEVYTQITDICSDASPSPLQSETAKTYLSGLSVK